MPWVHRTDATVCHMDSCIRDDHKAVDEETLVLIESAKHLNTPPQYAEVIREQVVAPAQPRWRHKDGSLCPDWESCDTYEHTSADGNETIQRIKARPPVEDAEADGYCVQCKHAFWIHGGPESSGCNAIGCDCNRYYIAAAVDDGVKSNPEREGISDTVDELIDGRVNVYGDPVMGFTRHAQVWTGILGIEVQPWQVALCMLGYKLVRTGITPDYSDNSDDIEGYLDIFRQLMPDMVQARDTAEYLAGGGQGARA